MKLAVGNGQIASQRRNIVTIHLTLENSKGEVCDEKHRFVGLAGT